MKTNISNRLRDYLMQILIHEEDKDAWEQFKKLDPDCDDLTNVIMWTSFTNEAWEVIKQKNVAKDVLLHIIEHAEMKQIQEEAEILLLQKYSLNNEELELVTKYNGSDKAAKKLLTQNPTNHELETIVIHSNCRNEAAQELLSRDVTNSTLVEIIQYTDYKAEAWEKLIQNDATNQEIIQVVQCTDYEEIAWDYLLTLNPTNEELFDIVKDYAEVRRKINEAATILLQRNLPIGDLTDFLRVDIYADEAWKRLQSKKNLTYGNLKRLLLHDKCSKKNEIGAWCLTLPPEKNRLFDVLSYTDKKDEAAAQLIQMDLEWHELADIIVASTIEPVLETISKRANFDRSLVKESELIHQVSTKIIENSDLLNVNNWHNEESHCLGGWAITLTESAQEIEKKYGSEIAACLLLPNYKHLFFADKQTVLEQLRQITST